MKIIVTGSNGFLGRHLMTLLRKMDYDPYGVLSRAYDLRIEHNIKALFKHTGPVDVVYHLAAHVGGIQYNIDHPGELFYDNVIMNTQLIHYAMLTGVKKFVMVGSVCSYPAYNPIPTREHRLWEGYPEASNGPYGVAKLVALDQLRAYNKQYGLNFAYPILSNLYGPGGDADNYKSHVIPALLNRFKSNPRQVEIWGDGSPTRDFLYVKDAAEALAQYLTVDYCEPVNIANGIETSIKHIVDSIARIIEYKGKIVYDTTRPNGQARRGYNTYNARTFLKWQASTRFEDGLRQTIEWHIEND